MPTIQSVQKLQFGRQISPLVKTTSLQVDSLEEVTLSIDGVPKLEAVKERKASKTSAKRTSSKRMNRVTYKPALSNVKLLAIYNNGQGSGLRIKVGRSKMETLTEPLIYMGRDAAVFKPDTTIVLENDSAASKSVVLLIGSDLSKDARQFELVEPAPSQKEVLAKSKNAVKVSKTAK